MTINNVAKRIAQNITIERSRNFSHNELNLAVMLEGCPFLVASIDPYNLPMGTIESEVRMSEYLASIIYTAVRRALSREKTVMPEFKRIGME